LNNKKLGSSLFCGTKDLGCAVFPAPPTDMCCLLPLYGAFQPHRASTRLFIVSRVAKNISSHE
jgi:hypothetical protein